MMMNALPVIGEVVPWEPPQGILGAPLRDEHNQSITRWFILRNAPQKETAACVRLKKLGVLEAWYPVERVTKTKRGATVPVERERRIAPGYVFTEWAYEPRWHLLKELSRGTVTGVVSIFDKPWAIKEETIAKMAKVPERIEALRRAEEQRVREERAKHQPVVGGMAKLLTGPLADVPNLLVKVVAIRGEDAAWEAGDMKGTAKLAAMERAA